MFFKKKIEIYIVMLYILALPISTNAMKKNRTYETKITTNEIQNQNSEEEKSQDNKNNTKIYDIKSKLNDIKNKLNNINIFNFVHCMNDLRHCKQKLVNLKKETNDEESLKTIDGLLDDINKLNILIIQNIKEKINEIKKQDFEYMNINSFNYYMNGLKRCKQNLLNLKNETNDEETINTIEKILNEANKFIIERVKSKIKIIKKQDLKNIDTYDIQHYKTELKFYIQEILDLKNETNDEETINTINNISNGVDRSIITKIKLEINKIKEQNLKNANKENISSYLINLNDYLQILLELKKESTNKKNLNTIEYILKDIDKLIVKKSELYMKKSEKENFEKNDEDGNNNLLNNINFTNPNFNQNLNIKKSKSDTDLIKNFKINK